MSIKGRPYSDLTDRELNTVKESVERLLKRKLDVKAQTVLRKIWDELKDERVERIAGDKDLPDFSSDFESERNAVEHTEKVKEKEVTEIKVRKSVGLKRSKRLLDRKGK